MPHGGWVATFEDITEQRKFEQERERHGEFLNQIIDNVPAMIVVKDAVERKFVHANRAAEAFWGFSRDGGDRQDAARAFPARQCRRDRQCRYRSAEVRRCDRAGGAPEHGASGRSAPGDVKAAHHSRRRRQAASCWSSVVEDVTERKRLEQERDRDREFLNQIIDNVPTTDRRPKDVHSPAICSDQSTAGVEHFGVPREEIIGKTRGRNLSEKRPT